MTKNAFILTVVIFLAMGLALLDECRFLIPYRMLIIHKYGAPIIMFSAGLFVNVFTGLYLLLRKISLKDTGRKLSHLDKQIRSGHSIAEELKQYLED